MFQCLRNAVIVLTLISAVSPFQNDPRDSGTSWQRQLFNVANGFLRGDRSIQLTDEVSIVRIKADNATSGNPTFLDSVRSFMDSGAIRFRLGGLVDDEETTEPQDEMEGRGKGKKRKSGGKKTMKKLKKLEYMLLGLIIAVKFKYALLAATMGNAIAAIALKSLLISKIALTLGIILFLKKLVSSSKQSSSDTASFSFQNSHGWDKRRDHHDEYYYDATALAYRNQRPEYQRRIAGLKRL